MVLEIEWGYMGLPYCFSLGSTIPSGLHGLTWGSTSIGGSTKLTQCTPEFLKTTSDSGASLILWLDFMKYGVVSSTELNNTIEFVSRALGALPSQSCCFCIAPQMSSERRSGLREEWRLGWVAPLFLEDVQITIVFFYCASKGFGCFYILYNI